MSDIRLQAGDETSDLMADLLFASVEEKDFDSPTEKDLAKTAAVACRRAIVAEAEVARLRAVIDEHHCQKVDDKAIMLAKQRCEAGGWPSYAELEIEVARLRSVLNEIRDMANHEIACRILEPDSNIWQIAAGASAGLRQED